MANDPKQAKAFETVKATNEKMFSAMTAYYSLNPTFHAIAMLVCDLMFYGYFLYVLIKYGSSE